MEEKSFEEVIIDGLRAVYILLQENKTELQTICGTLNGIKETEDNNGRMLRDIQSKLFELSALEEDRTDFRSHVQTDVHKILNDTAIISNTLLRIRNASEGGQGEI